MIKNIVFDMGGVLIHFKPAALLAHFDISPADRDLMLKEAFGSVAWIQLDRGIAAPQEAADRMCRCLPQRLHGAVRELTAGWWRGPLLPVEGMAELVRELKGLGYGIYLLSNAGLDHPKYFDRIPGSECFDGRVVSAFYKLLKPQPELYQILLREYNLKGEECFFVDDLNINVEAAMLTGMSGTVFRGAGELRRSLREAGIPVSGGDSA